MRFTSPWLLTLLVLVPLLAALAVVESRRRAVRLAKLVDLGLVPAVVVGVSDRRRVAKSVAVVSAVLFAVVAAAGPVTEGQPRLLPRQGVDVLFVVDVSRSMRARDVAPDRLERTKAEISSLLDRLADQRVGVVAFAGTAFLQCPLTTDVEAVRLFLKDLAPEVVPHGGTDIRAGLEVARNALLAEDEASGAAAKKIGRVIVVVSDGEDHDMLDDAPTGTAAADGLRANTSSLEGVGDALKDINASVVVVGVGSTLGEPIPIANERGDITGYVKDKRGQTVVSRMSPEILHAVANAVSGTFVDGSARPDLGLAEVEAKIASLEKRELEARTVKDDVDRSAPFAALALLCTLLWLLVPESKRPAEGSS